MIERLKIQGHSIDVANTISSRGNGRVLAYVQEGSGFTRASALEEAQNNMIVMKSRKLIVAGIYVGFKTCGDETVSSDTIESFKFYSKFILSCIQSSYVYKFLHYRFIFSIYSFYHNRLDFIIVGLLKSQRHTLIKLQC